MSDKRDRSPIAKGSCDDRRHGESKQRSSRWGHREAKSEAEPSRQRWDDRVSEEIKSSSLHSQWDSPIAYPSAQYNAVSGTNKAAQESGNGQYEGFQSKPFYEVASSIRNDEPKKVQDFRNKPFYEVASSIAIVPPPPTCHEVEPRKDICHNPAPILETSQTQDRSPSDTIQKPKVLQPKKPAKKITVANAFGDDSSSDEEMPPEAKMRMKNVGKFTPTAAGPNSFGKGGIGFCDRRKVVERQLMEDMDKIK